MTDVYAALRALLRAEPTITDLTDRVYVGEIPREEVTELPGKVIVLAPSGGMEHNQLLPLLDPRIDLWSLGETYYEASALDRAVFEVLRHIVRKTINGVLIHSIGWSGGPFMVRDDLTGWPSLWRSIVVNADARPTNGG
jgi:hypothetical protein